MSEKSAQMTRYFLGSAFTTFGLIQTSLMPTFYFTRYLVMICKVRYVAMVRGQQLNTCVWKIFLA